MLGALIELSRLKYKGQKMSRKEKLLIQIQRSWEFSHEEEPPFPEIEAWVAPLGKRQLSIVVTPKVDTGFNGFLAVSNALAKKIGLKPYGRVPIATATDVVEAPIYRVLLTQPELGLNHKQVTALGATRNLVGRRLLERNAWLLDFSSRKFSLVST